MLACPECLRPFAAGRCPCRRDWTETGGVPDLFAAAPDRGEDPALTSKIRAFYEDHPPRDDARWAPDPLHLALDAALPPGARVVDLGTGAGLGAAWLAREGREVLGLDLSMAALLRAEANRRREGLASLSFVRANLLRPPIEPQSAGAVLLLGAAEHCGYAEAAVAAAAALLAPGGLLVLRVSTEAAPPSVPAPPHDGRYPVEAVAAWLEAAGVRPLGDDAPAALAAQITPSRGGWLGAALRRWTSGRAVAEAVVIGRR